MSKKKKDTLDYTTSVDAMGLTKGMSIRWDGVYQTITAHITDLAGRRIIIHTEGNDDHGRIRVHIIDYGTMVNVGTVIQYGVDPLVPSDVIPIHLSHGSKARDLALNTVDRIGGRLMIRRVLPNDTWISGGQPVTGWVAADK